MSLPRSLHPFDLVMASTRLYSSLPVVGKHLEPFAGLTAMAMYGHHYAPAAVRGMVTRRFGAAPEAAPADAADASIASQRGTRVPPYLRFRAQRQKCLYRRSVRYGDHPAQLLDVWRLPDLPPDAPVLLFVPGGAWVQGSRVMQGHTMLHHLVKQGWVCLTMDYRVSPLHRWPRQIADVNAAIAWARANVDKYGGDRNFVAVAGCSAGGHLASLAALTPGDPAFRGELTTDADTSVDAVVGIYGRYDWQDRSTPARRNFQNFLERVVVGRRQSRHPDIFTAASPLARIHKDAPPFLLVHGEQDTIIPVGEAREFGERLRAVSRNTVEYSEIPRAGHAFDLVDSSHARRLAVEVSNFLTDVRDRQLQGEAAAAV
ncbi:MULTISPECIES: alpha/beta hydrolase [unclassified Mycobacterium]|uniref:alpha/beta hydrolase n=1 Tax=unclassified Mycobacterium TaxID=2642494 RepID=UPI00073FBE86|nr:MULTISPECIES: alpha/beta hydrolase [unclassified Mycobacterium]KUH85860.1 esterase [Mycobacterium sp. GA-1999]KUH91716.1 esterase [Mycobacterium sp. GA-0227b]KUH96569.1 esterase [Mycobacterium sp. IS-1556]